MLQGRFEWTVGLVGTVVVVLIASWYSVLWNQGGVRQVVQSVSTVRAQAELAAPTAVRPAAAGPRRSAAERAESTFRFRATGGESWLQVRERAHGGRVLFEGTLAPGRSVGFRAEQLWVRFGAAANVGLRVDGSPVALPLVGTFDAVAGPSGVRADPRVYEPPAQATAAQSP